MLGKHIKKADPLDLPDLLGATSALQRHGLFAYAPESWSFGSLGKDPARHGVSRQWSSIGFLNEAVNGNGPFPMLCDCIRIESDFHPAAGDRMWSDHCSSETME